MIQRRVDGDGNAVYMKKCSACRNWKPLMEFNKQRVKKDGLRLTCRKCDGERRIKYRLENKERNKGRDVTVGPPKKCTKCGELKPLTEFSKGRGAPDGLNSWCKKCDSKQGKKYRLENKERIKEKKEERNKKYNLKNKEKIKERHRKHYLQSKKNFSGIYQERLLAGDGCCMWCFENNLFKLNNHHIWGKENSDETFTFCENHHAIFTRGYGKMFEFLADM